jgi:uracil-DNA glycosylase family protein
MAAIPGRSALDYFPDKLDYEHLRDASENCRGCDLYKVGTQTVFGEGPKCPGVMMVGEQPGDEEDKQGLPFVGPAGRLLTKALGDAGIDRELVYMTNAVKHFKWKPAGKRRLHQKPNAGEVNACRPWLTAEIEVLKPKIITLLGATAAQSLLGSSFKVTQMRGKWLEHETGAKLIATVHPSSILRAGENRAEQYSLFVHDLDVIAAGMKELGIG